jgi:hypothetical protein
MQELLCWGTFWITILALVFHALRSRPGWKLSDAVKFSLCSFALAVAFKVFIPTSIELRHFFSAIPAMALLGIGWLNSSVQSRIILFGSWVIALGMNMFCLTYIPQGLTGYQPVANCLASQSEEGNILLATMDDQDLIFRFRTMTDGYPRYMLRSDRILAVRLPEYANVSADILVKTEDEFMDVIQRGRIRLIVTCVAGPDSSDNRTEEMAFSHDLVSRSDDHFRLIGGFPLHRDFVQPRRLFRPTKKQMYRVFVWKYLGKVEPGALENSVRIPTAELEFSY